ncbi:MAG: 3-phosphoshikimate 1-carboxyvinyltransferase [Lachnospiraceae bacterium]|nr:3-phosphoshikimate 1-carboxyvinyltransferase [Lachnospiraceae bacterium]
MNEIIQGTTIYLRPITESDTDMVLTWRNSDRTVSNFYYRTPISTEDHLSWIRNKVNKGEVYQYIVCMKEGDVPVGCVYLQHIEADTLTGETGVFFSEGAPAGKGLATEAVKLIGEKVGFEMLGLLHLTAKVMEKNTASRRVHEKAGYRLVKTVQGESCTDGEIVNSLYYIKDADKTVIPRKALIKPHTGKITETEDGYLIKVPGSKSITNRALLIAMLAEGTTVLNGVLFSDDTESFLNCMDSLGIETVVDRENCTVTVTGCGGDIPMKEASLNVGSAGTAARFLTAVLGLVKDGVYHMDSSDQMKKRPMAPLLNSLINLGCEVEYEGEEGFFPFTLKPHGIKKDETTVDIDKSSQFLSALIIASAFIKPDLQINVTGKHGMTYVDMTKKMVSESVELTRGRTPLSDEFPDKGVRPHVSYDIEPDASAAAYFFAMSPLIGKSVTIAGLHEDSMQGDTGFVKVLQNIGWLTYEDTPAGIRVSCDIGDVPHCQTDSLTKGYVPNVTIDMSTCSDQTITLAAIAPFTGKNIRITGISHIRVQESDRISAIVTELTKLGVKCSEDGDDILIDVSCPHPAEIETYNDHRMAMGFSLLGLKVPGITILNPSCCGKTFPDYFAYLYEIM